MARLKVSDLLPGTDYVVQVRAWRDGEHSKWSEKFFFTTIEDTATPAAPVATWESIGDSFLATWAPVTLDTEGNPINIASYEMEFHGGSITKYKTIAATTGADNTYTLTYAENANMFNGAKGTVDFRVRAISKKGVKGEWCAVLTAGNEPPAMVGNFTATPIIEGVELTWDANTEDDLVGYLIYVGATAGFVPSTLNQIFFGNATSFIYFTDTFTELWFKIRAIDKMGLVSEDAVASATPKSPFVVDVEPPPVPFSFSVTITNNPDGVGAVADLSWDIDVTEDLVGFWVRYRKVGDTFWQTIPFQKDDRSGIIELAEAYTNYEFQIRAQDTTANQSAWSSTVTAISPGNTPPGSVSGLVSTAGKDSITYYWNPTGDSDILNYELTVSTSATFASGNITFMAGTATTLTVGGLNPGTTYYARVRAVDRGGLTSSTWSATDTETTGTFASPTPSDGYAPGSSPTPNVLGGLSYLYVTWDDVTLNSNGGAQVDPVTYEVHLSTTTGFTPSAATKVTEISGTSAIIDVLPGTTTALSYGTTYYVKLKAKDRDGAAAAGSQGSGTISKVASTDVTSIGADLIVPGTGFVNALVVNTGGSIQSSNYSAGTAGYKLDTSGLEINNGSVKASLLTAGTLSSSTGTIQIGAGASIVLNGGYLKSNTYTGTSQASNPSGAGFYLGNDGLRIDQGMVNVAALTSGTMTSTAITLSGAGASITGTGFSLSGTGLTVTSGTIAAAAITITTAFSNSVGANMTTIDGGIIKTGSIISTANARNIDDTADLSPVQPAWSIQTNGAAQFGRVSVIGRMVIGSASYGVNSGIQSYNYNPGALPDPTGWRVNGAGEAFFYNLTAAGNITSGGANAVTMTTAANPFESNSSWGIIKFEADAGSGLYPGQVWSHYSASRSYLSLTSPYINNNGPTTAARLYLSTGTTQSSTEAELLAATLKLSGNTMYLNSSNGTTYDMKVYNTNVISLRQGTGDQRLNINLGYGTNDISINPRNSTNTSDIRLTINADMCLMTLTSGQILFSAGTNIGGRVGRNGLGGALIFQSGYLVAGTWAYNASNPLSNNTVDFYANTVHAFAAFDNMSDRRAKKFISDVSPEKAYEIVRNTKIKKYQMRSGKGDWEYGIIAQDMLDVFPDVVRENASGHYSAAYQNIWAMNLAATQVLQDKNEQLETQVDELTERLAALETLVSSLSS